MLLSQIHLLTIPNVSVTINSITIDINNSNNISTVMLSQFNSNTKTTSMGIMTNHIIASTLMKQSHTLNFIANNTSNKVQ